MSALERQVGGSHYKDLPIQPIEYILANDLPFCEGNIVKYVTRWKQKGGRQDLEKVIHYAQLLLDDLEPAEPISFGEAAMKAQYDASSDRIAAGLKLGELRSQFQAAIERDGGSQIYYDSLTGKYYTK